MQYQYTRVWDNYTGKPARASVKGRPITVYGVPCFLYHSTAGTRSWYVIEASSGAAIGTGKTQDQAINAATGTIARNGVDSVVVAAKACTPVADLPDISFGMAV